MIKFERSFKHDRIRLIKKDDVIYYSAFDVAFALRIENKRKAVNQAVIMENGSFLDMVQWEDEKVLFISSEYVIAIAWKAEWELAKEFIKWMLEVVSVAQKLRQDDHESTLDNVKDYFATTQIAKKYGLSAIQLNEILHENRIQYRVNDQWVLYSEYQDKGLIKIVEIQKGQDKKIFHTYWTSAGVSFIENLLKSLGYEAKAKQLSLF